MSNGITINGRVQTAIAGFHPATIYGELSPKDGEVGQIGMRVFSIVLDEVSPKNEFFDNGTYPLMVFPVELVDVSLGIFGKREWVALDSEEGMEALEESTDYIARRRAYGEAVAN